MDELKCRHCGLDCRNTAIWQNDLVFCCEGCKTVYNILQHGKLNRYYRIMEMPGIRLDAIPEGGRFAWLDRDDIIRKLLEYRQGNVSRVRWFIPSIHCSSCIWLLENLGKLNPGIIHSEVNFPTREVTISFRHDAISVRQLAELLSSIHYIPEINPDDDGKATQKANRKKGRRLIKQLGVAGFCFANIMLLSLPEYFSHGAGLEKEYRLLFGIFNVLLIIPLVFYSAADYLLSGFRNLRKGIINIDLPISIGISALLFQSLWDFVTGIGPGYFDSLAGFVFFLLIGKWFQQHTYEALSFERDYKSFFPVGVLKVDEKGIETSVLLSELKKGDIVRIRNYEIIPADGILRSTVAHIDYSFVSGESDIIECSKGTEVFAGGRQKGSSIEIELTSDVEQSRLTRLWNHDIQTDKREKSGLKPLIDSVSQYFTIGVILIAAATLFFWLHSDASLALPAFVSVLIVACPCALALTLPFTYGNAMRIMGESGLFLKNAAVVEKLSSARTIVFDKTGTLTEQGKQEVVYSGDELSTENHKLLRSAFRHSTHPLSQAVMQYLDDGDYFEPDFFEEIPSRGIRMIVGPIWIKAGSEKYVLGTVSESNPGSRVYIELSDGKTGLFRIRTVFRSGLSQLFEMLEPDYRIHLLSGDGEQDAPRLKPYFRPDFMHFNLMPSDKLTYIQQLKKQDTGVIMAGDGLNDAGALAASDVGISVAGSVYHFTPACDAILQASSFDNLAKILLFARRTKQVVYASFLFSVLYNLAGLWFAVQGLLTPVIAAILMPLSSLTIVVFTTFATKRLGRAWLNVK